MKKISSFFQRIGNWCKNHKTVVALIVTGLFILGQIPFLLNHEIWGDEATPWEISKQINLGNIYELNDAEPHPLLWEIILAPFSQNNFPVITLNIISLAIVSLAVFLLVRFAPFNLFVKIIFILSNAFFYYNPVIARDYCLIPLAITLIGIAYKNRHEKPLRYTLSLVFLSQTHFLVYGLLAVLILGFIIEEIKSEHKLKKTILTIIKFSAPIVVILAFTIPIMISSLKNHAILTGREYEIASEVDRKEFVPSLQGAFYGENQILNIVVIIFVGLLLFGLIANNIKLSFYAVVSIAFWCFVMANMYKIYTMIEQKISIITFILLLMTWLIYLEPKSKANLMARVLNCSEIIKFLKLKVRYPIVIVIVVLVAFTIPRAIYDSVWDLEYQFSTSEENASFFNSLPDGSVIIGEDIGAYGIFSADLRSKIINNLRIYNLSLDIDDKDTHFLKYNGEAVDLIKNKKELSLDDVLNKIDELAVENDHVYYIRESYRTPCNGNKPTIPVWMEKHELITELDYGHYKIGGLSPVLVFKIK